MRVCSHRMVSMQIYIIVSLRKSKQIKQEW